jgi:predicted membrane-bound spermidine synthase
MLLSRTYILCLVFIEGAAVMAAELIGAKLIGPLYGNSLYIWAAVLGITLFSLTLGYYLGGWLSLRFSNLVQWIAILALLGGGLMLSLMPWLSLSVMTLFVEGNIVFGAVISLFVFLFPTLCLFGISTPLFIRLLNDEAGSSGRTSGFVYAISTLGGIISTFTFGFYLLENFGITWPCFYLGMLVVLACCISIIWSRRYLLILSLLPLCLFYTIYQKKNLVSGDTELVYESEGIFGQIRVIDAPVETYLRGRHIGRTLYVNNVGQSTAFRDRLEYDSWDWSYFFPTVASVTPKGGDALLMGLGGGTIWHQYNRLGLKTEVVELDERIKNTAIQYFGVSPFANIVVDDARHFINTSRKTYDLITFDMFLNETPPAQVLSIETFLKVKKMLRPQGLWMINYFGYTEGTKGKSARSILKTLQHAGFHVEIMVTPSEDESSRNVIFLASHKPIDFSKINYEEKDLPKITDITKHFLPLKDIDTNDAEILTDERPRFDHMYIEPSLDWRKRTIEYQIKPILESEINLIK